MSPKIYDDAEQTYCEVRQLLMQNDFEGAETAIRKLQDAKYKEGYSDAIKNYAVWNNGEQFVGVMRRPLKTVLQEVEESSGKILL